MQVTGRASDAPADAVHGPPHSLTDITKFSLVSPFHADCQPLPWIKGCAPTPSAKPSPTKPARNRRNRPTVTSYLSIMNGATVTGWSGCSLAKPVLSAEPAMKSPPGTASSSEQGGENPSAAQGSGATVRVNVVRASCCNPSTSTTARVIRYGPANAG